MKGLLQKATKEWREVRAFFDLLARPGRAPVVAVGLLTLLRGLLPFAVIVATGVLVDAVPGTVDAGLGSREGTRALQALVVLASAFLTLGTADAVVAYAGRAVGTRYAITVHDATAAAAARPEGIAELENPAVAAELAAVDEYDRANLYRVAVQRLTELTTLRVQGLAAFVILLGFRWWAPLVMLAGWRLVNRSVVEWVKKGVALGHVQSGAGLRRAQYYRSLAVEAPAAKEVRIFGLGGWVVDRYAATWRHAMRRIWEGRKASWRGVFLGAGGLAVAHAAVLAALGRTALGGAITVGELVVFAQAALAMAMLGPLGDVQWQAGRILHAARRVVELEERLTPDVTPAATSVAEASPLRVPSSGPIGAQLAAVEFTYPGRDEPTLRGLDLAIPAGQSVAIVGKNGAGKTTLIKLLCGLYRPDAGRVSIDGYLDPAAARDRIGVIFQEFVRYELPLRANVGYGYLDLVADTDQLAAALRDAGAEDLPRLLPAGWDSILARGYENGAELSGGQWQKVALARALTAIRGGAGLLILDEPTANLDVRAEAALFDRFLELTRGVTTLLVSHRLSSVRRVDRIVVLADGRIAEDGSHRELMDSGGLYARMYALQAERFGIPRGATPAAPAREVSTVA